MKYLMALEATKEMKEGKLIVFLLNLHMSLHSGIGFPKSHLENDADVSFSP